MASGSKVRCKIDNFSISLTQFSSCALEFTFRLKFFYVSYIFMWNDIFSTLKYVCKEKL